MAWWYLVDAACVTALTAVFIITLLRLPANRIPPSADPPDLVLWVNVRDGIAKILRSTSKND